jgi:hypothetical protein
LHLFKIEATNGFCDPCGETVTSSVAALAKVSPQIQTFCSRGGDVSTINKRKVVGVTEPTQERWEVEQREESKKSGKVATKKISKFERRKNKFLNVFEK